MAVHAFLSASGAYRWLNCTPSAKLEQKMPEEHSEYAAEGSFAHELAELHLSRYLDLILVKDHRKKHKKLKGNQFYSQELEDHVKTYVDLCIEKINAARAKTKDAVILLEQKVDFSPWVPEGFGTGDLIIIAAGTLEIVDLKFGKGVPVSAENNPQMKLYGLGAYNQFDMLYDIEKIAMTIMQPRLDSVSTEELTTDDLLYWATNTVMGAAEKAMAGEGELVAGDHCKFCRVKAVCRARAELNLEMAKYDFQDPPLLSHDEIAEILTKAEELRAWASDVQAYALDQAEKHGVKFPGWKLVEGRSNRKYLDDEKVAEALTAAGYEEDKLYIKSLLGITAMEKFVGKKKFSEVLEGLVIKPAGKPTLVPENDKRPEINSAAAAAEDFKD